MLKFWLIVLAVFGLDQGTKLAVQRLLAPGLSTEVAGQILRFTYVLNPGGAFGILGDRQMVLLAIGILTVVVVLGTLPWIIRAGYVWPVGLLFGGALGNLADRLRCGKVVDFIDVGFWPVFNVADVAIVAGAVLLSFLLLRRENGQRGGPDGHA